MPQPREVTLLPDGVHILWADGHGSTYPHRYLRAQCCCATCISETTGRRLVFLADVTADVEALDWMSVGRYALQFLWSDAHTTGIYPFTLLRQLCQCDQCRKERAASQP
ncbi:MAG: DUF971 domain-containing protein [Chloroflexi bacterium]|nr:DUF971 domain-containing protein [Chloroflexota bacterium]